MEIHDGKMITLTKGGVSIEKTNGEKVERAAYTAQIDASDLEKGDLSVLHSEGNR